MIGGEDNRGRGLVHRGLRPAVDVDRAEGNWASNGAMFFIEFQARFCFNRSNAMNVVVKSEPAARLSAGQQAALITLLADEDPLVFRAVREKLVSYGPVVADWLRPHTISVDPLLRRRALEIVTVFGRHGADDCFLAFCLQHGENLDLETGAWLLARTQYPDINLEAYQALLDSYAADLRERLNPRGNARHILGVINEYLFAELGFTGNEEHYYDPQNSYLNCVLDRRTGIPISLSLVYLLLARRLRLPISGIGLPGHFVCRFQSTSEELYIDAFHGGRLMTKADCVHYLLHGHYALQDEYLTPATPRRMLTRLCGNLHQTYNQLEMTEEVTRVRRYLVALTH
jgi:regulator of sirC expression with transglutaminase-like and TPR domain